MWWRWIAWGAAALVGGYLAILVLFALYFALAAYIPILTRKIRGCGPPSGRRGDRAA